MRIPLGFYLYAYLRAVDSKDGNWLAQTPYYIGKGTGDRAWCPNRNTPKPPDPNNIVILLDGQTEEDALALEVMLIKQFGRKDIGTGCLHNRTDGGEGASGRKMSDAQRAKLRVDNSGKNHPMYGKPSPRRGTKLSAEWCHNLSLGHLGKPSSRLGTTHTPETLHKMSLGHKGIRTTLGKKLAGASSHFYGVYWNKARQNWHVHVGFNGKLKHVGRHRDERIAAQLYDRFVIEQNLDKPRNFPGMTLTDLPQMKKRKWVRRSLTSKE